MTRFQFWALAALVLVVGLVGFADAGLLFFRRRCVARCNSSCATQPAYAPCMVQPANPCPDCPVCPVCPVNDAPANAGNQGDTLFGVDRSTGVGKVDKLCIGGACSTPKTGQTKAPQTILPEDATKPYVVIVGDQGFQKQAAEIVHRHKLDESHHVVSYSESDWQAKDVGYSKGVWFVEARGKDGKAAVMSLDDDLGNLDASLSKHAEALRRPGGVLDRLKVPTLSKALDTSALVWDGVKPYMPVAANLGALSMLGLAFLRKAG